MSTAGPLGDDERRELMSELERRVGEHEAAGDYDRAWLDAVVAETDPATPVDEFLRTAPLRRREHVAALGVPAAAGRREALDQRLRDALAWLALAAEQEARAREGVANGLEAAEIARRRLGERVGDLEQAIQALGFAHGERVYRLEDDRRWIASETLRRSYPDLVAPAAAPLDLEGVEARAFSQNGEDGIILHLFSLIGPGDRRFVEIGVEDGRECNTANLALNFGWSGVMIDRDAPGVASAQAFYAARPRTAETVRILQRHVTREGIDDLLVEVAGEGDLDLLSIDIDGNDLWVWEAVKRTSPRVVVVEYNASFGPARSVSVPYDPGFDRMERHPSGHYHGASLQALTRLAVRKGYILAGCDSNGVNAFFVRSDCARGVMGAADPATAWRPIRERGPATTDEQFAAIAHLPLEDVP